MQSKHHLYAELIWSESANESLVFSILNYLNFSNGFGLIRESAVYLFPLFFFLNKIKLVNFLVLTVSSFFY